MADKSNIEWTEATWNPIVGCSIVSPGCTNCYAMKMARRIESMQPGSHYAGTTQVVNGNTVWTGKVALAPEHILTQPLRWCRPRKIFVNSMGDLFHESVPDEWIDRVFAVMALAPQHTFQVLTKRSARMRVYLSAGDMRLRVQDVVDNMEPNGIHKFADHEPWVANNFPLRNVWLGVSTEDQRQADERVPDLLATPSAVRFVSAEPLIGPIKFSGSTATEGWDWFTGSAFEVDPTPPASIWNGNTGRTIDWVIVGGESGPSARPMHPDWVRAIRDPCAAAGVPFFFKQWGMYLPAGQQFSITFGKDADGRDINLGTALRTGQAIAMDGLWTYRVGKRAAGRVLDGIEHNAMPEARR